MENAVSDYLASLPEDKKQGLNLLREAVLAGLPAGFEERLQYRMLAYVVPHSLYPEGYHCDPKEPLPFLHLAAQKNHLALYHLGLYADQALLEWFQKAWAEKASVKLDMGKSCIRFKKAAHIPMDLITQLAGKMEVQHWISLYEKAVRRL